MNCAQTWQRSAGTALGPSEQARSRADLMREAVDDVLSRLRRQDRRVPLRCNRGPWKDRGTLRPEGSAVARHRFSGSGA